MRMTFVFLLAAALLAGCDNNNQDTDPSAAKQGTADAQGHTGELVRILHTLEKTDEQCQGDGCPKVNLAWITFENQPTLNEAITTQLAGMLVQNQGSPPMTAPSKAWWMPSLPMPQTWPWRPNKAGS